MLAVSTLEPVPVLAVNASFEVFELCHVTLALSFSDEPPEARPWQELLLGSLSVAVMVPEPPVFLLGVQLPSFPLAVAVCGVGVGPMPGLMLTVPVMVL